MTEYKTWYRTVGGSREWTTNSLVHPTAEQAVLAGAELSLRWQLVAEWAVVPHEETPFHLDDAYIDANAVERGTVR